MQALGGIGADGGVWIDATFGRGGHSAAILDLLGGQGTLLAIDKDPAAAEAAGKLEPRPDFRFRRQSFTCLEQWVRELGWAGAVRGILFDLGVSSPQLDEPHRGFSFLRDGPLDMRMDPDSEPSAAQWLQHAGEREIADVLKNYGEERFHRRMARAIVAARQQSPITTTSRLAEVVAAANPRWEKHKHPATRVFQALRIMVNRELDELAEALRQAVMVLAPRGRLVVISFHSLEDRLVKRFLREQSRPPALPRRLPVAEERSGGPLRIVAKPIRAGVSEVSSNPRARSAILRVAERSA